MSRSIHIYSDSLRLPQQLPICMSYLLITQKELSEILKVSEHTIRRLTKAGMPCLYVGTTGHRGSNSAVRYNLEEVQAWLKDRQQKGGQA